MPSGSQASENPAAAGRQTQALNGAWGHVGPGSLSPNLSLPSVYSKIMSCIQSLTSNDDFRRAKPAHCASVPPATEKVACKQQGSRHFLGIPLPYLLGKGGKGKGA